MLKGSIVITRRDGLNAEAEIARMGAGQFTGEMSQLAGRGTLASGRAGPDGCTALPFDAAHIRALMIGSAELGEIVMRAFILRRVGLIEDRRRRLGADRRARHGRLVRVQTSCAATAIRTRCSTPPTDAEGRALVERFGVPTEELPVLVCPNGTVLSGRARPRPACCLGITPEIDPDGV